MIRTTIQTRPQIGTTVSYRCTYHRDEKIRSAVVVGYSDSHGEDTVHLAVLTDDADDLDMMSLSVPHDETATTVGSWHYQGSPGEGGGAGQTNEAPSA